MKKLLIATVYLSACLLCTCAKSSDTAAGNSITGKWILTETLADPGNGSGQWKPAAMPGYYYAQFNADSSFEGNSYTGTGAIKRYSLQRNNMLHLIDSNGRDYTYSYTLVSTSLTITGACIEACGSKFTRAH